MRVLDHALRVLVQVAGRLSPEEGLLVLGVGLLHHLVGGAVRVVTLLVHYLGLGLGLDHHFGLVVAGCLLVQAVEGAAGAGGLDGRGGTVRVVLRRVTALGRGGVALAGGVLVLGGAFGLVVGRTIRYHGVVGADLVARLLRPLTVCDAERTVLLLDQISLLLGLTLHRHDALPRKVLGCIVPLRNLVQGAARLALGK